MQKCFGKPIFPIPPNQCPVKLSLQLQKTQPLNIDWVGERGGVGAVSIVTAKLTDISAFPKVLHTIVATSWNACLESCELYD